MKKAEKKMKEVLNPNETKNINFVEKTNKLIKYVVISETNANVINSLVELYNEDRYKARVKYFNSPSTYTKQRLVYFKFPNGNFEFAKFNVKCGISKTNKMYFRETKMSSIGYKNGKLYYTNANMYRHLTYTLLKSFSNDVEVMSKFIKEFSWIRMFSEHSWITNISFNTVIKNKLYSLTDIKKHVFKLPLPVIDTIIDTDFFKQNYFINGGFKYFNEILNNLENITSITPELIDDNNFIDTCRMAKILGRKINCKWGSNRLKNEHDAWSKEITNILLECEKEFDLIIRKVYQDFSEFSGYKLLKTNKELLYEGMVMKHCVGTYIDRVNNGYCAIFSIKNHTLELKYFNNELSIVQFKGKFNLTAPKELYDEVIYHMERFNKDKEINCNNETLFFADIF
jgi:hypothetical protein